MHKKGDKKPKILFFLSLLNLISIQKRKRKIQKISNVNLSVCYWKPSNCKGIKNEREGHTSMTKFEKNPTKTIEKLLFTTVDKKGGKGTAI